MAETLICPNCRYEIDVSTTLAAQLRDRLKGEFAAESRRREQEILKQAENAARANAALEIEDLQNQLREAAGRLTLAQQVELELRKDRRQLEDQKRELELTVTRRLDQEIAQVRDTAKKEAAEENRLREAESQKLITDLRDQIAMLTRRVEQGSPQVQGEALEWDLERLLQELFPLDSIDAVPVGVHGGDVVQTVRDARGLECGTILWEFKRTKAWNDAWLPKLRDDQRNAKAHLAVLASVELPRGLATFGCRGGIWVTSRNCLPGLAAALRVILIEVDRTRRSFEGQQTKIDLLYQYLCSPEFQHRIEGIVEAFQTMKDDLESEKRSMHRIWAKRQKQIERVAVNTAGFYGDLEGILGAKLPPIASLELPALALEPEIVEMEESVAPVSEDCPF